MLLVFIIKHKQKSNMNRKQRWSWTEGTRLNYSKLIPQDQTMMAAEWEKFNEDAEGPTKECKTKFRIVFEDQRQSWN